MTQKVLITRPQEDALPLAALLKKHGIETLIDPMLRIEYISGSPLDLSKVRALLMTSANGVRAFCRRSQERDLPVYAVGDATMREANAQGFQDVKTASGDVDALAKLVVASETDQSGVFLHSAGTDIAGSLGTRLEAAGFRYNRQVLYKAVAASQLNEEVCGAIREHQIRGVLLYSPRTAKIFSKAAAQAALATDLSKMSAYCLSNAVAEKLSGVRWRSVRVATHPTQADLLEIVLDDV